MNNTITEMKNILNGISNRLDEAEDGIGGLEDKVAENAEMKQQKENEDCLRDRGDNIKYNNVRIREATEGEERQQGTES